MDIRTLTPGFSVSPQIQSSDLAQLAAAGFQSVICNRPDSEVGGGLSSAEMKQAAEAAGLNWAENIIVSGAMTQENVSRQGELAAALPGPVLAYCRSGTRSATAWALSQAGLIPVDEILAATARAGYALDGLRHHIETIEAQKV